MQIAAERYVIYAPENAKAFTLPPAYNAEVDRQSREEMQGCLANAIE